MAIGPIYFGSKASVMTDDEKQEAKDNGIRDLGLILTISQAVLSSNITLHTPCDVLYLVPMLIGC